MFIRDELRVGSDIVGNFTVDWAAQSHVGQVREANEDAAHVGMGSYLLADGMGGHEAGEIASEAALLAMSEVEQSDLVATRDSVRERLSIAQQAIAAIDTSSDRQAGTTLTGALLVADEEVMFWLIVNIGDSRTYRYSNGVLEQITVDHSQVQDLIDAGFLTEEQARIDPRRNVITRALGAGMQPEIDFFALPAVAGDCLMVCSDGLTGELPDAEITTILAAGDSAEVTVRCLIDAANAAGGRDNVTVILASVS